MIQPPFQLPELRTSPLRLLVVGGAVQYSKSILETCSSLTQATHFYWVKNTAAALAILASSPAFDIVICDTAAVDQTEFLYHAAEHDPAAFILIAGECGTLFESAAILVQRRGARLLGVLPKPLNPSQLVPMISSFCRAGNTKHTRRQTVAGRSWTTQELLHALEERQFIPYFQPKVDLKSGRRTCVEVLARWRHPELGILQPDEFISPMEREGLIDQLTASLLRQSLALAGGFERRGWRFGMAINVSPLTLEDSSVPRKLYSLVQEHGIPSDRITIEVTETAASSDISTVMESLARMRMLGFEISVDDFGTGYSSFERLTQVPFTELKIDRSFVAALSTADRKAGAIVCTIMQLARRLRLRTVAEGIETKDQLAVIRRLGCTSGQGYLLGKPMTPAGFMAEWQQDNMCAA